MRNASYCPQCDGFNTEQVHQEFHGDAIQLVMICEDCQLQYTVEFGDPIVVSARDENAQPVDLEQ